MKNTERTGALKTATGKHEQSSATGRQKTATGRQSTATGRQSTATGRQKSATSRQQTVTARQKAATARQQSVTARQRAIEQKNREKKRKNRKLTLYVIFTSVAAAIIIVAAFILKGAAQQRSYNNFYSAALQSFYAGEYDSALASLRRASAVSETEEATMLMVDCYEQQGNYAKALELLRGLDTSDPVVSSRIAEIERKSREIVDDSIVTVVGKQYDVSTTSLVLRDTGMGDGILTDVLKLYSLTSLTLTGNNLTNISPLSALGGLVFLDVSDNSISDLSPLSGLRELKTLYLDNNPITDFSPLYSLTQLDTLSIRGIAITDEQLRELSAALPNCAIHSETATKTAAEISLGGATFKSDATEIDLSGMGISDISALAACKNLRKLDLTGNSISDLTPLMDIPTLEWLSIKDNLVTDLRPLMGMSSLRYINAEGNGVTGTAALATLSDLNELYLAYNPISDLSGVRRLGNLRRLGLEGTGLTDDDLKELYGLTSLDILLIYDNPELSGEAVDELKKNLRGCNVEHSELLYSIEIGGVKYREDATELELSGLGISDITAISGFGKVEKIDLSDNNIENIYILQWMSAPIRELDLSGNNISDCNALMYLEDLEWLDISDNNLSSASPIMKLTGLKYLKISGNPLPEDQIEDLHAMLPDCEIIFD